MITSRNVASVKARIQLAARSWKTNKKIVVIESDDWGSIRTSSAEAYKELTNKGYLVDRSPYMLDALESEDDLSALFDVLVAHRDSAGEHPKITANVIMGNPDFYRIESSQFTQYFYEPVQDTLKNAPNSQNVERLWKEGLANGLFIPQLHGREHVRYWEWLKALRADSSESLDTFKLRMCGVPLAVSKSGLGFFKPLYIEKTELDNNGVDLESLISEGAELFEKTFGYRSTTTVAPNVAWTDQAEAIWSKCGVRYVQGGFLQEVHARSKIRYISHFLGEKNLLGMRYLVRNCTFEPSKNNNDDYWKDTFRQVKRAFLLKTPAIISTHRVNYIGSIKERNRHRGLTQLNSLIEAVIRAYPDVMFMSSDELGDSLH